MTQSTFDITSERLCDRFRNHCANCLYQEDWNCIVLFSRNYKDVSCINARNILGLYDCKEFRGDGRSTETS